MGGVIRLFQRRSRDISYLTNDEALEIDTLRDGAALWWPSAPRVLDDPREVLTAQGRSGVVGYDLVVAAPRPMSALLAVGTSDERIAVVAAHREAVRGALAYLDEHALFVRRSVLGEVDEHRVQWRAAAGFTHGINRAGEPHLHDHVLVGARRDAHRLALDSRTLYGHLGAADALYRAGLRHALTRDTSLVAWRSFAGTEFVAGVDEGVRALWPGRAADRDDKVHWTREAAQRRWQDDLTRYEPGPHVAPPGRARDRLNEHAFGASLANRHLIVRTDLVEAWANAATFGSPAREVTNAIDHWYPELSDQRGVPRRTISRTAAMRNREVTERGARPLVVERDDQRSSREIVRDSIVRERERW